jgi:sugar phosphate isomerase/epimerase
MSNSRRSFLRGAALTSVALSMPFKNELMAMAAKKHQFGIQLWTVKQALGKDVVGTLQQLGALGYNHVESFEGKNGIFWGLKNTEFKKVLTDNGMTIHSAHASNTVDFERKAAEAAEIGMKYLICPYKGPQKTMDDYKKFIDEFNTAGTIAKKHGIRFAYHNHDYTFKPMDGVMPQDVIMKGTDADLVDFEMDIYWVVAAGIDPIEYFNKYPNRFRLAHVKDQTKNAAGNLESCVIGNGTIDFKKILAAGQKKGLNTFIVEQEAYTGTTEMGCAKDNAAYMKNFSW